MYLSIHSAGMKLVFHFLLTGLLSVCNAQCPKGWMQFENDCFLLDKTHVSWYDATQYCKLHGQSRLVTAETREKNIFVKQYLEIMNYHGSAWIGGNDDIKKGHWVWVGRDEPITYFDWGGNEPDNDPRIENCIIMYHSYQFKWADGGCENKYGFVCEKSVHNCDPSPQTTTSNT